MYAKKPAVIAATTLAVLGGGSAAAFAAGSGGSQSGTTTAKAPTVEIPVKGTAGTGSLSVTGPKGKTVSSTDAKVACAALGGEYVVYERVKGSDGKRGAEVRIVVDDYEGPGTYDAMVSLGHHRRGDHAAKITTGTKTSATTKKDHRGRRGGFGKGVTEPVTITSSGGSTSFTITLSGKKDAALAGKTVKVAADWTCAV